MLALLLPVVLAADVDWNDHIAALGTDPEPCTWSWEPEELPPLCPAADAAFQEVFVDGALGPPGSWESYVAMGRALQAGERRLRVADDRAAVDGEFAGLLRSLDRLTLRGGDVNALYVVLHWAPRLLDAYAALPGPTGPAVVAALSRAPLTDAVLATPLVLGCEQVVARPTAELFSWFMEPVRGAWQVSTVGQVDLLPWFVNTDDLKRRTRRHCVRTVGAALAGHPPPVEPRAPWKHRGSTYVIDSLLGEWEAEGGPGHLVRGIRAYEARRLALVGTADAPGPGGVDPR